MALRVKPTPTQFQPSSLYTPMDSTPLHSLSGVRAGVSHLTCCCFSQQALAKAYTVKDGEAIFVQADENGR